MITANDQASNMAEVFPNWSCDRPSSRTSIWVGQLQPHKTTYTVRIEYTEPIALEGKSTLYIQPLVEVISPRLEFQFDNPEGPLPHVYRKHPRTKRAGPFLCLFDDQKSEWTPKDMISNTTIPWTSAWLSCYESWVATGKWFGTGRHISNIETARDIVTSLKEHYYGTTSYKALTRHTNSTS